MSNLDEILDRADEMMSEVAIAAANKRAAKRDHRDDCNRVPRHTYDFDCERCVTTAKARAKRIARAVTINATPIERVACRVFGTGRPETMDGLCKPCHVDITNDILEERAAGC